MSVQEGMPAEDYSNSIGRIEQSDALISLTRLEALAATLDLGGLPDGGKTVPAGWHWLFFNPFLRRSSLGVDGHPKRGGFLPAVSLPRRMWAGGNLRYHAPLPVGVMARRVSEISDISAKSGKTGQLIFVTVRHKIFHGDAIVIEEIQDIVYREAPQARGVSPALPAAPEVSRWSEKIVPDPVLLFRYSALTSNGHRIHYDAPYAREDEGYRDLVVHGPLIATLLQGLAARCRPESKLVDFTFRGMAPLFVDSAFHIEAVPAEVGSGLKLWARGPEGELAMQAKAEFAP